MEELIVMVLNLLELKLLKVETMVRSWLILFFFGYLKGAISYAWRLVF